MDRLERSTYAGYKFYRLALILFSIIPKIKKGVTGNRNLDYPQLHADPGSRWSDSNARDPPSKGG